ncbi:MAG: hypothetical protein M0Z68_05675 [Gammaproteobacteria bacterium]|nr:hypothetical protein [Gammaproteobacteria bacterium]
MTRNVISLEEGAELRRLLAEHTEATLYAGAILNKYGMESAEFREADKATGLLWRRIREIQGLSDQHWMA